MKTCVTSIAIMMLGSFLLITAMSMSQLEGKIIEFSKVNPTPSEKLPEKLSPNLPSTIQNKFRIQLNSIEILNTHNGNSPSSWKMWLGVFQNHTWWDPDSKTIEIPDNLLSPVNKGQKIDFSKSKVYADINMDPGPFCCPLSPKIGIINEETFLIVNIYGTALQQKGDVFATENLGTIWKPFGVLSSFGIGTHTILSSTGDYKINFTIKYF